MERFQWTEEKIATLEALWREGHTASAIAEKMGCPSRNSVLGKVHRENMEPRRMTYAVRKMRKRAKIKADAELKPAQAAETKRPQPLPVVMEQKTSPSLKGIHDLGPKDCRYPIGEPEKSGFGFCGKPVEYGQVYCGEHCRQAYPNHKPTIDLARAA